MNDTDTEACQTQRLPTNNSCLLSYRTVFIPPNKMQFHFIWKTFWCSNWTLETRNTKENQSNFQREGEKGKNNFELVIETHGFIINYLHFNDIKVLNISGGKLDASSGSKPNVELKCIAHRIEINDSLHFTYICDFNFQCHFTMFPFRHLDIQV